MVLVMPRVDTQDSNCSRSGPDPQTSISIGIANSTPAIASKKSFNPLLEASLPKYASLIEARPSRPRRRKPGIGASGKHGSQFKGFPLNPLTTHDRVIEGA